MESVKPVSPGTTEDTDWGASCTVVAPAAAGAASTSVTGSIGPGPPELALSRIRGRIPCACSACNSATNPLGSDSWVGFA